MQSHPVTMVIFALWVAQMIWKDEWRYASEDNGGQCVMIYGASLMQELPASNLA